MFYDKLSLRKNYTNAETFKKKETKKLCFNGLHCFNYNTYLCCNNYKAFKLKCYCDLWLFIVKLTAVKVKFIV